MNSLNSGSVAGAAGNHVDVFKQDQFNNNINNNSNSNNDGNINNINISNINISNINISNININNIDALPTNTFNILSQGNNEDDDDDEDDIDNENEESFHQLLAQQQQQQHQQQHQQQQQQPHYHHQNESPTTKTVDAYDDRLQNMPQTLVNGDQVFQGCNSANTSWSEAQASFTDRNNGNNNNIVNINGNNINNNNNENINIIVSNSSSNNVININSSNLLYLPNGGNYTLLQKLSTPQNFQTIKLFDESMTSADDDNVGTCLYRPNSAHIPNNNNFNNQQRVIFVNAATNESQTAKFVEKLDQIPTQPSDPTYIVRFSEDSQHLDTSVMNSNASNDSLPQIFDNNDGVGNDLGIEDDLCLHESADLYISSETGAGSVIQLSNVDSNESNSFQKSPASLVNFEMPVQVSKEGVLRSNSLDSSIKQYTQLLLNQPSLLLPQQQQQQQQTANFILTPDLHQNLIFQPAQNIQLLPQQQQQQQQLQQFQQLQQQTKPQIQLAQKPQSQPTSFNTQMFLQQNIQIPPQQLVTSLNMLQQLKLSQDLFKTPLQGHNILNTSQLNLGRSLDEQTLLNVNQARQTKPPRNRNQTAKSNKTESAITGKQNSSGTTNEKDSQELERVMNILKHYKQQIASNDQESQFLPCKRKRSKPPESSSASNAATNNTASTNNNFTFNSNNLSQTKLTSPNILPNLNLTLNFPAKQIESKQDVSNVVLESGNAVDSSNSSLESSSSFAVSNANNLQNILLAQNSKLVSLLSCGPNELAANVSNTVLKLPNSQSTNISLKPQLFSTSNPIVDNQIVLSSLHHHLPPNVSIQIPAAKPMKTVILSSARSGNSSTISVNNNAVVPSLDDSLHSQSTSIAGKILVNNIPGATVPHGLLNLQQQQQQQQQKQQQQQLNSSGGCVSISSTSNNVITVSAANKKIANVQDLIVNSLLQKNLPKIIQQFAQKNSIRTAPVGSDLLNSSLSLSSLSYANNNSNSVSYCLDSNSNQTPLSTTTNITVSELMHSELNEISSIVKIAETANASESRSIAIYHNSNDTANVINNVCTVSSSSSNCGSMACSSSSSSAGDGRLMIVQSSSAMDDKLLANRFFSLLQSKGSTANKLSISENSLTALSGNINNNNNSQNGGHNNIFSNVLAMKYGDSAVSNSGYCETKHIPVISLLDSSQETDRSDPRSITIDAYYPDMKGGILMKHNNNPTFTSQIFSNNNFIHSSNNDFNLNNNISMKTEHLDGKYFMDSLCAETDDITKTLKYAMSKKWTDHNDVKRWLMERFKTPDEEGIRLEKVEYRLQKPNNRSFDFSSKQVLQRKNEQEKIMCLLTPTDNNANDNSINNINANDNNCNNNNNNNIDDDGDDADEFGYKIAGLVVWEAVDDDDDDVERLNVECLFGLQPVEVERRRRNRSDKSYKPASTPVKWTLNGEGSFVVSRVNNEPYVKLKLSDQSCRLVQQFTRKISNMYDHVSSHSMEERMAWAEATTLYNNFDEKSTTTTQDERDNVDVYCYLALNRQSRIENSRNKGVERQVGIWRVFPMCTLSQFRDDSLPDYATICRSSSSRSRHLNVNNNNNNNNHNNVNNNHNNNHNSSGGCSGRPLADRTCVKTTSGDKLDASGSGIIEEVDKRGPVKCDLKMETDDVMIPTCASHDRKRKLSSSPCATSPSTSSSTSSSASSTSIAALSTATFPATTSSTSTGAPSISSSSPAATTEADGECMVSLKFKIRKTSHEKQTDVVESDQQQPKQQAQHYYCVRPRRQKSQRQIEHDQLEQQQQMNKLSNLRTRQQRQQQQQNIKDINNTTTSNITNNNASESIITDLNKNSSCINTSSSQTSPPVVAVSLASPPTLATSSASSSSLSTLPASTLASQLPLSPTSTTTTPTNVDNKRFAKQQQQQQQHGSKNHTYSSMKLRERTQPQPKQTESGIFIQLIHGSAYFEVVGSNFVRSNSITNHSSNQICLRFQRNKVTANNSTATNITTIVTTAYNISSTATTSNAITTTTATTIALATTATAGSVAATVANVAATVASVAATVASVAVPVSFGGRDGPVKVDDVFKVDVEIKSDGDDDYDSDDKGKIMKLSSSSSSLITTSSSTISDLKYVISSPSSSSSFLESETLSSSSSSSSLLSSTLTLSVAANPSIRDKESSPSSFLPSPSSLLSSSSSFLPSSSSLLSSSLSFLSSSSSTPLLTSSLPACSQLIETNPSPSNLVICQIDCLSSLPSSSALTSSSSSFPSDNVSLELMAAVDSSISSSPPSSLSSLQQLSSSLPSPPSSLQSLSQLLLSSSSSTEPSFPTSSSLNISSSSSSATLPSLNESNDSDVIITASPTQFIFREMLLAPVNSSATMTTDSMVTGWIKPKLATTGPYQCCDWILGSFVS